MQHHRKMAVAGAFYPQNCKKLKIYFHKFSEMVSPQTRADPIFSVNPRAIIVPHAGYVYSGFTANLAYMILSHASATRVIVIGPSHHHYFQGISGSYFESYQTPCGDIEIDTGYLIDLARRFKIGFEEKAHRKEHSTEVQMPFIRHYLPKAKVIELVYGDISSGQIAEIITYLLLDPQNTVVISSDLSHFHTQEKAKELDTHCLRAISLLDRGKLAKGCEACGITGIDAMIEAAKKLGLRSKLIDYRTSADYSGDRSRVVGYASAVFY
jgi:AmmeMemoRadiSam system protein B